MARAPFLFLLFFLLIGATLYTQMGSFLSHAAGERISLSSQSGIQNTQTASVKAVVFMADLVTFSPGEQGQFEFVSPQAGQSCVTTSPTSNAQGEITGSCSSTIAGDFPVKIVLLTTQEQATTTVTFLPEPAPTPSPTPNVTPTPSPNPTTTPSPSPTASPSPSPTPVQVVSGTYTLTPTESVISFSNDVNTTYNVNVVLKDAVSGEPIVNQTGITYFWSTNDTSIVQLDETKAQCVGTVVPPCPQSNGVFSGYKPGNALIFIVTKKDGAVIANTQVEVTVTKTTTGQPRYIEPTASPTAAPTASPSPSSSNNNNSNSGTTQATTPQPTVTPTASPSPRPSFFPAIAGPIATANEEIAQIGEVLGSVSETILDTVAPLESPTPEQKEERNSHISMLNVFIIMTIVLGIISILMPLYGKHKQKILPYQVKVVQFLTPWLGKVRLFVTPMLSQVRKQIMSVRNTSESVCQQLQNKSEQLRLKLEPIQRIIQNRLELHNK